MTEPNPALTGTPKMASVPDKPDVPKALMAPLEPQDSLLIVPFMRSSPEKPVGGWTFEPWDKAVQDRVKDEHRDYFLRVAAAYRPKTGGGANLYALVPVDDSPMSHHRLMQAIAYSVWSSGNQDDVTRDSFLVEPIVYPGDDLAKYNPERRAAAPLFYANVRPDDIVPGMCALFECADATSPEAAGLLTKHSDERREEIQQICPGVHQSDLPPAMGEVFEPVDTAWPYKAADLAKRVARAAEWYLTARQVAAVWPDGRAPQVVALGVAFESLFTEMKSDEADRKANDAKLAIINSARESPESDSSEAVALRLNTHFDDYCESRQHQRVTLTLKARLSELVTRDPDYRGVWGDIAVWVKGFYKLRSDILHGRGIEPERFSYNGLSYVYTARLSVEWLLWNFLKQLRLLPFGASLWVSHLKEKALAAQTPNKAKLQRIVELVRQEAWQSDEGASQLVDLMEHISPNEVKSWETQLADEAVTAIGEMCAKLDYRIPRQKLILWQESEFRVKVTMLKALRQYIARTEQRPS